jgi:hypothetical protein
MRVKVNKHYKRNNEYQYILISVIYNINTQERLIEVVEKQITILKILLI